MIMNNRYFISSVILHALAIALLLPYSLQHQLQIKPGDSEQQSIDAYVSENIITTKSITNVENKKGIAIKTNKKITTSSAKNKMQSHATSKGEQTKGLLALLHNAIQKQQQYPDSAMEMGREGRTTVAFKLFQDGHITQVAVSKSSGTQILDSAAITAVTQAAPFAGVAQYISEPGEYSIDVVFEIAQA